MKKIVIIILALVFTSCTNNKNSNELIKLSGPVFGTGFNIQYSSEDKQNYIEDINALFDTINQSLSTYIPDSDISRINKGEDLKIDVHFKHDFKCSQDIYELTEGVFDPTISNVVNAWNFGAETNKFLTDSTTIDSLMQFVRLNRVSLIDNKIQKPSGIYLEFNAIAKGYGVDAVANFLENKSVENYLVEIGGEVRVKGKNIEKMSPWRVGLDEPRFDGEQSVFKGISLTDEAMATSGTYRKFKTDVNGNRYAHIINTETGYPSKTNVLSVSVIAKDCMTADAYATAFQAMGIERVKEFLKTHKDLKVYFIYEDENQILQTLNLNGFPEN